MSSLRVAIVAVAMVVLVEAVVVDMMRMIGTLVLLEVMETERKEIVKRNGARAVRGGTRGVRRRVGWGRDSRE